MTSTVLGAKPAQEETLSSAMIFLLASACGLVVANLYYAQPLAGVIGAELGLSPGATGLIVTLTQIGYGLGLLFVVPLGDLIENRKLIVTTVFMAVAALVAAAIAPHAAQFLVAVFLVGVSSVAVQMIVPLAAHMTPPATRGRVVGSIMSGLMVGIMLARPVSSVLSEFVAWRGVFLMSAVVMVVLALVLYRLLPRRMPDAKLPYRSLLASMGTLAASTPLLQRRALYHAGMFSAFSLFWTVTPLYLSGPAFKLSQGEIALFALAGAAGAVAAPIAGRLADRGWTWGATFNGIIPHHPHCAGRFTSVAGPARRCGHRAGFRGHHQSGLGPARHFHAGCGVPQPFERHIHGDILHGRRGWFGTRWLGLCDRTMDRGLMARFCAASPRLRLFPHGAPA
jgi:predicted MFS family arabinose efflux permease